MVAPFKLVPLLSFYGAYHNNAMYVSSVTERYP